MSTAESDPPGEAVRRIIEAARSQARALDLSRCELTAVPDSVRLLTSLTELDLSENWLTAAPDWTGQLDSLTKLNLRGSELTAVPDSIGRLTSLTELWLG